MKRLVIKDKSDFSYHVEVDGVVNTKHTYRIPFFYDNLSDKFEYHILECVDPENPIDQVCCIIDSKGNPIIKAKSKYGRIFRVVNDDDIFTVDGEVYIPKFDLLIGEGKIMSSRTKYYIKTNQWKKSTKSGLYTINKNFKEYSFEHEKHEQYDYTVFHTDGPVEREREV